MIFHLKLLITKKIRENLQKLQIKSVEKFNREDKKAKTNYTVRTQHSFFSYLFTVISVHF